MSGYCAIGKPRMAPRPSTTMMIDITIATIGRLTKKRAIGLLRLGGRLGRLRGCTPRRHWFGAHSHAVLQRLDAFCDHLFPWFQALLDHPQRVHSRTDNHIAECHFVALDDRHAAKVL